MPTPFYHLSVALELLQVQQIPEVARQRLLRYADAFLLGNTAPDVQTVSGQSRQETHFFTVPPAANGPLPWEELLARYPQTARPERLPAEQVAFWAGYLCHLQADWLWIQELYLPVFGPQANWSDFGERLFLHNVLRAYLDRQFLAGLSNGVSEQLQSLDVHDWMPFVPANALVQWRDLLAEQLGPQGAVQTVAVFAGRSGVPVQEFDALLKDEVQLERRVFQRLSRQALQRYREQVVHENCNLLVNYLNPLSGGDHESL